MKQKMIAAFLICCICLSGCTNGVPFWVQTYSVRFWQGEKLISEQQVVGGRMPEEVLPEEVPGGIFVGWDMPITEIREEIDLHAVYVPILDRHVPYLFAMEDGLIHPEAPFTADALCAALNALADDSAKAFFPELPEGDSALTAGELEQILSFFFLNVDSFENLEADAQLTRLDAVWILNALLGRTDESITPNTFAKGFPDVKPGTYAEILEAAVPHKSGEQSWEQIELPTDHEPGWLLTDGKLQYFDEQGYLVSGETLGNGMQINEAGYYTSGNEELDRLVSELLVSFQTENPEADRDELLKTAYVYCRDNFKYLRKGFYSMGDTGWEVEDAIAMFTNGKGNCYNYAASFWALARGLGYDVSVVSGTITGPSGANYPHGWVKQDVDGITYYFDPETEMTFLRDGDIWQSLFYVRKNDACGQLHYQEATT